MIVLIGGVLCLVESKTSPARRAALRIHRHMLRPTMKSFHTRVWFGQVASQLCVAALLQREREVRTHVATLLQREREVRTLIDPNC